MDGTGPGGAARATGGRIAAVLSGLRRTGEYPLFYFGLTAFGVSCLLWSLLAGLLHRLLPRRIGVPFGQFAIMAGFRSYLSVMEALGLFRCDLRALDTLRDEASLVITPNHPSLLDAVLVISRLPRVVCITKAALWDNPFLGGSVRLASYIRNDTPVTLVRRAVEELRAGRQLLVFPEGTRTIRPPVNAFKGGFAVMARQADAAVQTVFLESDNRYLCKGWPLFRKPPLPVVFRARLGRRFLVSGDVHAFVADLERYMGRELAGQAPAKLTPHQRA